MCQRSLSRFAFSCLAAGLLAACDLRTEPEMKPRYRPSDDVRSVEDLHPEDQALVRRHEEEFERAHPHWRDDRVSGDEAWRSGLHVGVSEVALPGGADAVVVREASSEFPNIAVLPRWGLTDRIYLIAAMALVEDREREPQPSGRRVLRVWATGRVEVEGTEESFTMPGPFPVRGLDVMREVRAALPGASLVDFEGLGPVRVLPWGAEGR